MIRILSGVLLGVGGVLVAIGSKAATTISDLTATTSAVMTTITDNFVTVIVGFLQNNLPIIVVLGFAIMLVWFLISKARNAAMGG